MFKKSGLVMTALITLVAAIVAGCGAAAPEPTATVEPPAATTIPPTEAPAPTDTPEPTATEVSMVITAENVDSLKVVNVINASDDQLTAVDFQPGTHTVAAYGWDTLVRIFDADTGEGERVLAGHGDWGLGMGYSADGSELASGGRGGDIRLWQTDNGQLMRTLTGAANRVYTLEWSRDGEKFAVGGDFSSTVSVFSKSGQRLEDIKLPAGWAWSMAWSDDYLAIANDTARSIYIYDAESYSLVNQLFHGGNPAGEMDFSPDGSLLVSCHRDPMMYFWNVSDWSQVAAFEAHPKVGEEQGCIGGDFSKDGDVYFSGGDDGYMNAWSTDDGSPLETFNFRSMVWAVSVSEDGELIATAMADGTIRILALDLE